jgi:hypothetical protein
MLLIAVFYPLFIHDMMTSVDTNEEFHRPGESLSNEVSTMHRIFYDYAAQNCHHLLYIHIIFEPRHNKTNIMGLRPAWIQTSLRIRAV